MTTLPDKNNNNTRHVSSPDVSVNQLTKTFTNEGDTTEREQIKIGDNLYKFQNGIQPKAY